MSEAAIRLEQVVKTFAGSATPAVDGLSLEVPPGEIVMFVGPSGCGKTTTLKMINRLVEPTSGRILVNGTDIASLPAHELRRGIGYVIQQIGLFPHRTIAGNIAIVPELLGWDDRRTRDRVDELVELMGLDPAMKARYPSELSGGQRQRVGVARALAADPPVLLMDEPFGAVDPIVRARLQEELLRLQDRVGKTIVFVTHDIDEAIALGDRVAILDVGGRLEQFDTPEAILRDPASAFVADFLGKERGLKRLSLYAVADVELDRGPVVEASDSPADVRGVMAHHGVDWVGVLDHGQLRGWVWGADVEGVAHVGDVPARDFRVVVGSGASLREALDAIVNTRNRVAVVQDQGRYVGMLWLEQISDELTNR